MKGTLKAQYVNPFLESVHELFARMLNVQVTRKSVGLSDGSKRPGEVMALVGLSGTVRGTVGLALPRATALAAVGRFLGTSVEEGDETISDTVGELVNIVGGSAKAKLSEALGTTLDLTLPTVIRGDDYSVYSPSNSYWLEVSFTSQLGPFSLRVCMQLDE